MKLRSALIISGCVLFASCEKNTMSKIPQISLVGIAPDFVKANLDTAVIAFNFTDGDADLGNSSTSLVFVKDKRYDTGYVRYVFPRIESAVEDPKKGMTGTAYVFLLDPPVVPRADSVHMVLGDTTFFEVYVTDRAGHESNHIITKDILLKP